MTCCTETGTPLCKPAGWPCVAVSGGGLSYLPLRRQPACLAPGPDAPLAYWDAPLVHYSKLQDNSAREWGFSAGALVGSIQIIVCTRASRAQQV